LGAAEANTAKLAADLAAAEHIAAAKAAALATTETALTSASADLEVARGCIRDKEAKVYCQVVQDQLRDSSCWLPVEQQVVAYLPTTPDTSSHRQYSFGGAMLEKLLLFCFVIASPTCPCCTVPLQRIQQPKGSYHYQ
jgi:hypothetical protein